MSFVSESVFTRGHMHADRKESRPVTRQVTREVSREVSRLVGTVTR